MTATGYLTHDSAPASTAPAAAAAKLKAGRHSQHVLVRRYPTLATLPTGSVLVVGGSIIEAGGYYGDPSTTAQYNNPSYQIYSPTLQTMTPSVVMQQLVRWPASLPALLLHS